MDAKQSLELESVRPARNGLVARFKGIVDRTAAEQIRNLELFVPRDRLPQPGADEFYHSDLIGLKALTKNGGEFGTVVAIHNFGAGDVLELRSGGRSATVMLPFTVSAVPVVDIAAGRIIVDPPQGLLKA